MEKKKDLMKDADSHASIIMDTIVEKTVEYYKKDDLATRLYLEHADMTQEESLTMLSNIFITRLYEQMIEFTDLFDDLEQNGPDGAVALFRMSKQIVEEDGVSEDKILEDLVSMGMRYAVFEDWDYTFSVLDAMNWLDKSSSVDRDRYKKTVDYLYDAYSVEDYEVETA
tara:strand:- start:534 stop:1040 length:507 start_codon:yes stop_codon:yes gene_type:complete